MRNFLFDAFIMSPMWINRKFSSNEKLRTSMSPNISTNNSLGLCPQSIVIKVASFFDKSYNFSEKAFIKYLATEPTFPCKLVFMLIWIHILSTFSVSTNTWIFPYFDFITVNKT